MIRSLIGSQWLWRMKTSAPRMLSPKRQYSSPLANVDSTISPSGTLRCSAISLLSCSLPRPAKSMRFFLVTSSIAPMFPRRPR